MACDGPDSHPTLSLNWRIQSCDRVVNSSECFAATSQPAYTLESAAFGGFWLYETTRNPSKSTEIHRNPFKEASKSAHARLPQRLHKVPPRFRRRHGAFVSSTSDAWLFKP